VGVAEILVSGQSSIRRGVLVARAHPAAVVAGLTLLALGLRAPQLDQSLFGDELPALWVIADRSLAGVFVALRDGPDPNPPLFFLLAWLSAKLGDPTVWLRLPSLVFAAALVPATYVLGRMTVGRVAGLAGSAVVASRRSRSSTRSRRAPTRWSRSSPSPRRSAC
jgi:hypothetical protein